MPNITLSIRDDDTPLWDYARRYAANHHTTLSGLATRALADHLRRQPDDNRGHDITVTTGTDGQEKRVVFQGRWLVHPNEINDENAFERVGIAQTGKGRIAVYWCLGSDRYLDDYDTMNEARAARPAVGTEEIWAKAQAALTPPTRLDI